MSTACAKRLVYEKDLSIVRAGVANRPCTRGQ